MQMFNTYVNTNNCTCNKLAGGGAYKTSLV